MKLRYFCQVVPIIKAIYLKICNWKSVNYQGIPAVRLCHHINIRGAASLIYLNRFNSAGSVVINVGGDDSYNGKIEFRIGRNCYFNHNAVISCRKKIVIGEGSIFGPNLCVFDHDHEFSLTGVDRSNKYRTGDIIIGAHCWVGANVVILKNTTIGDGSIIGAGCVVKGEIPPHSVVTASNRSLKVRPITKSLVIVNGKEEKL